MRFQPKTENEIAAAGLFPAGEYNFEITDASEETSKAGNDMLKLVATVYNGAGQQTLVFDYLVDTERTAYKIRHFAAAVGLLPAYERGQLTAPDCVGRAGRCKLAIVKDKNGQYPDRNGIADYLAPAGGAAPSRTAAMAGAPSRDLDDEIPF